MTEVQYDSLKKKFGHCASWAIWDEDDTSTLNWATDRNILENMNTKFILVGFNQSTLNPNEEKIWWNFHSDDKSCELLSKVSHTKLKGSYITDIIKFGEDGQPLKNSNATEVKKYLKVHPEIVSRNVEIFKKELQFFNSPILIAMGRDSEEILIQSGLSQLYKCIYMCHYSTTAGKMHHNNPTTYLQVIRSQLANTGIRI